MRYRIFASLLMLVLCGCAAPGNWTGNVFYLPPPTVAVDLNPGGVRLQVVDADRILAHYTCPELRYQNQFGGWHTVDNEGWVDIPASMGGMNFQVIPNGRVESITALYDGNYVGNGMWFGVGNYHDNGQHRLVVTVTRAFEDRAGKSHSQSKTFVVHVMNKNGN